MEKRNTRRSTSTPDEKLHRGSHGEVRTGESRAGGSRMDRGQAGGVAARGLVNGRGPKRDLRPERNLFLFLDYNQHLAHYQEFTPHGASSHSP